MQALQENFNTFQTDWELYLAKQAGLCSCNTVNIFYVFSSLKILHQIVSLKPSETISSIVTLYSVL